MKTHLFLVLFCLVQFPSQVMADGYEETSKRWNEIKIQQSHLPQKAFTETKTNTPDRVQEARSDVLNTLDNILAKLSFFTGFVTFVSFSLFILMIIALLDICSSSFYSSDKIMWAIMVVVLPPIGTLLYLFIGRKHKVHKSTNHYLNRDEEPDFKGQKRHL